MIVIMTPLLEGSDFDRSARPGTAPQASSALAILLTASGLSLSLLIAIGILSFDFFRASAAAWLL